MFGFLRRHRAEQAAPAQDLSAAARQLASALRREDKPKHLRTNRALVRAMTDALRVDLRAKGHTHLEPIDWSKFP